MPKNAMAQNIQITNLLLVWVYLCWHHTGVGDEQEEGNKTKNEVTEIWYNET